MNKIKKLFSESSFSRVLDIIKKNPNIYFYTLLLDFVFISIIIFMGKYFGSLIPSDTQQLLSIFKSPANLLLFALLYIIIYYSFVLFIYSITKLSILNLIKKLYVKNIFTLKGIGKFYLLNILIFIIFFFTGLILFGMLAIIFRTEFLSYIVLILSIPFLLLWYSVINISHVLLMKDKKEKIIRKSFKIAFTKINEYGMFVAWDVIAVITYLLFYSLIHLIFRFAVFSNEQISSNFLPIYLKIFSIVSLIVLYLIISFNRIYFYERIDKDVL
ncbi:MAG: hypothetical protein U9O94_08180 [Nanoarchaeota archaeon]|nr:hypothetical protein [Nanoarchaeota archaeon]